MLARRYGLVEPPPTARRQFNALRQEEGETVEEYADRVLLKAYEGYPGVDDEVVETLAVEGFLRGCRDRGAAYAAAEHKPATLHEALQEMRDAAANLKVFGRNNTLGTARQVTFADRVEPEKHNMSREQEDMLRVLTDFFKVQQQTKSPLMKQSSTSNANSSRLGVRDRSSSPAGNRARSRSASPGTSRCYKCGELGHFKSDCTNSLKCWKCGGEGHISPDCRNATPEREPSSLETQKENGRGVGE